ncbi:DUF2793 domain-containing protein [Pseudogemmobacter faecipullorum]|uniref:DUF2793 domain-containing protein n=1 Tax=Pseudogemmobacter faecipullorum TaxID=2755041 RepID=A0ABS8CGF9_9RHOB|nr:DUF2793 domain-containing protein [Pseudogemmobacter faecipullorum]MCB5408460.1 DUF2793 domain-containing protein [Pseudogemmobacter faecipullorum]
MSDTTDILELPLILPAQAQKHVTHNEALLLLDALVQLAVADRDRSAPPALPVAGDRHIVAAGATGLWAGQEGQLAVMTAAGWQFLAPRPGWQAYLLSEARLAVYDGLSWVTPDQTAGSFARLGISATADAVNRLALASPAVLMSHAGAGMQLKLNKASAAETGSLLFQTGWSGRAEMGCTGSDDFAVKVSADGSAWQVALALGAATGIADFPQGLRVAGSPVCSRASLVGTVTQSAGLPTGAVLERGSNASGSWLRLADGTQICWHHGFSVANVSTALGAGFTSPAVSWSYPQSFLAGSAPVVSGLADGVDCWLAAAAPSASSASLRVLSFLSKAGSQALRVMAVGRWI